jgi:predicted Zn-dependent protease
LAGEVYEAKNDYDQAIREYSLALQNNPKLPQMHYRIGQLYLHQGSEEVDEKAMEEFRREKEINPESAVSDLAMADIEMHRHQLGRAKPLYEEAAKLDPTLTEARVGLAKISLEQHDTDAAVQELRAVIAEHPEDAAAHYSLMRAYREQKKMPEASAEMATFNRLQTEKADKFQNKMNALLNGKSTQVSNEAPVEESSPK